MSSSARNWSQNLLLQMRNLYRYVPVIEHGYKIKVIKVGLSTS
jgi:hypothetical protein